MATFETKSCRHCLGGGCYRCNNRGQIRTRLWSRSELSQRTARAEVFGTSGQLQQRREEPEKTLAWMRATA